MTQPALSVQVKELEGLIGAPLVERGPRQTRLTGLGEEFAARAAAILSAVDELQDMARASQGPLAGRLRIGVIPTIAPYLLPGVIRHLTTLYPGLDLQPREAVTQKLIAHLLEARLDAAIVALPISEPSLTEVKLFDEEFVLVRPVSDADKPVPNVDALQKMRLLLLEEGHCFRDQALEFCKIVSQSPRELMEGSSLSTLVQMVSAGIGVTLIPEMAAPIERRSAHISVARLRPPRPTRTIGMIWRKTNPLADQLQGIADVVRDAALERAVDAGRDALLAP
ncbi:LysR family transcriptional regulator, hydrogen peroxide-inducible genes activator [Tropicimonas isoalkanivorans]|uniref:LysR family transcriptional regulator, hydrogen peroxide-inducible genes activator n=1 Tax=Tropicimonas isoalkanivorans TaxID=441112 RepID=A0A1I1N906_9RHOB|nr:LysR family transcriptional regulator, hydrogen peroxide-inducible genes activator [Tropicimonas isoalkanivorans]